MGKKESVKKIFATNFWWKLCFRLIWTPVKIMSQVPNEPDLWFLRYQLQRSPQIQSPKHQRRKIQSPKNQRRNTLKNVDRMFKWTLILIIFTFLLLESSLFSPHQSPSLHVCSKLIFITHLLIFLPPINYQKSYKNPTTQK